MSLPVISIPTSWGMYSKQADRAFTKKAETFVRNLEETHGENNGGIVSKLKIFDQYIRSYAKTCRSNAYDGEASDTEVRISVMNFVHKVGKAHGLSYDTIEDVWRQHI